jgi:hypothetical protein
MPGRNGSLAKEIGIGATAGLAGTLVIQAAKFASEKWFPSTVPPIKEDPGKFMVEKAEAPLPRNVRKKIPEKLENTAAALLSFGYGMTFGTVYAAAHPQRQRAFRDGSAFGFITWAAGYLGWLPALDLMPRVDQQKPRQVLPNLASHLLYGIATVAIFGCIQRKLERS